MKIIFLLILLTLSFPLMAGSEYVRKAKALINKMVEVKKEKNRIITDAEKLPPKPRACEVQRALSYYKENLVPVAQELEDLRYTNLGKASASEEAEIDQEKQMKWSPIHHDNRPFEKAGREIDVAICQ